MATVHCLSLPSASSCLALPHRRPKGISMLSTTATSLPFKPLAFASSRSIAALPNAVGFGVGVAVEKRRPLRLSVVCEAATNKKADSVEKRARQSEKRRIYHKAKKSEMRTRMKKVLVALDKLRKKKDAKAEEILPIEKLIAEAYSAIDKAVRAGTLHRNTGANRKSRLARRKKFIEIRHGWYVPVVTA